MKKIFYVLSIIILFGFSDLYSQENNFIKVYLITCGPGTETYSIYGHSALRIVDQNTGSDLVYNWGTFDFSTPNFVWKFAKGKLQYMLGVTTFNSFRQEYFLEQRWLQIQEINLEPEEKQLLLQLITENLKPENRKYRYDFFYDNCSTRIRDLLEKIMGSKLFYPPDVPDKTESFRFMTGKYQSLYPWLNLGIDLLLGIPCDRKADFRERMFLPIEMQNGLSKTLLKRSGKMIPLLTNPETLLDFAEPQTKLLFYTSPTFVFSLTLIIIIIIFALIRKTIIVNIIDIILFGVFSCLALLMLFGNFMTEHPQMKWNLNILWLSPFLLICLAAIIFNKKWYSWFRVVFVLCITAFFVQVIFSRGFNTAFIPLILILIHRSSARAGFSWNPLSAELI
ncbi:MAG: DUF4105 domain-containing protein [Bacteroidales bacterium]|nr:DUF4105 domain-containing protein [Bacteroidales bacterium]